MLFDDIEISMLAYNIETVLAEKVETVLTKGTISSRMKDYFDIYVIKKLYYDKLSKNNLRKAFENTFKHRNNENLLTEYDKLLNEIKAKDNVKEYWDNYYKRNNLSGNTTIDTIIEEIRNIMNDLNK
jgi:predicted nucleotidyltransferase component of viral defense system